MNQSVEPLPRTDAREAATLMVVTEDFLASRVMLARLAWDGVVFDFYTADEGEAYYVHRDKSATLLGIDYPQVANKRVGAVTFHSVKEMARHMKLPAEFRYIQRLLK